MTRQEANRAKSAESVPSEARPTTTQTDKSVFDESQRMKIMTSFLEVMAKAAKFALNSKSWLQLVNIILYTWNAFSYDLTNPLELTTSSDAWKNIVVIAECSLFLLEFLQQGGQLRTQKGQDIDQVKN